MCKTSKAGVWRVIYIHVSFVFLTFWTWLRCWKGAKRETDQIEYNSFLHSQKTCFFRWYMYVACIEILCFYSLMYEYNKCWGCGWQYCMIVIPFTDKVSLLPLLLKIRNIAYNISISWKHCKTIIWHRLFALSCS